MVGMEFSKEELLHETDFVLDVMNGDRGEGQWRRKVR